MFQRVIEVIDPIFPFYRKIKRGTKIVKKLYFQTYRINIFKRFPAIKILELAICNRSGKKCRKGIFFGKLESRIKVSA